MNPPSTQQRRSMMSFVVIAIFAVGVSIFLIGKGSEAASEIDRLTAGPLAGSRTALGQELDDKGESEASSTVEKNPL